MDGFPTRTDGLLYLTEGGQETEVMYRHGFDLPEFAMFPLLEDPRAVVVLRDMYRSYLDVAAEHGFGALVGGLDYRASPDWAGLLGYSPAALADAQLGCIEFLREVAAPYRDQIPDIRIAGCIGPRGDAYRTDAVITAAEAEDYHATQLATLAAADVDFAEAMTFGSVDEAIGVARAAAAAGVPLTVSFTLDADSRVLSGPTLGEAIQRVDGETGDARPACFGINCSHPYEFLPAIESQTWFERVRILRPNAAMAEKAALCQLGHLEAGDPALLGRLMGELAGQHPHIDVWGGCCGTWDLHLHEIATNVAAVRGS
jgi:S-methylmethionine-dependent homocysteine/selenocysteine methylase